MQRRFAERLPLTLAATLLLPLVIAGMEAVAGYSRPSHAAWLFLLSAVGAYLPFSFLLCFGLSAAAPTRGLELWLPLSLGLGRGATFLTEAPRESALKGLLFLGMALLALLVLRTLLDRSRLEPADAAAAPLLGVTVGVALPILITHQALALGPRFGERRTALAGVVAGLALFMLLRAFVASVRWAAIPLMMLPIAAVAS